MKGAGPAVKAKIVIPSCGGVFKLDGEDEQAMFMIGQSQLH